MNGRRPGDTGARAKRERGFSRGSRRSRRPRRTRESSLRIPDASPVPTAVDAAAGRMLGCGRRSPSKASGRSVSHARSSGDGGTLYLVATPIGNLEDITRRALRILGEVDRVAAEDTRRTRRLLEHYGISAPVESLFEHNER